jgi:hypothetical protein
VWALGRSTRRRAVSPGVRKFRSIEDQRSSHLFIQIIQRLPWTRPHIAQFNRSNLRDGKRYTQLTGSPSAIPAGDPLEPCG